MDWTTPRTDYQKPDYERVRQARNLRVEGKTLEEIGAALGVSRQRAWQILRTPLPEEQPTTEAA